MGGLFLVHLWISNLGYHPSLDCCCPHGLHQKFVNQNLHKKVGKGIDNSDLIRYIYNIET